MKLHIRTCPECLVEFHTKRPKQVCCNSSCAAARRWRLDTALMRAFRVKAAETRRQKYTARLKKRFAGMSIGDVWRMAYQHGYSAGYQRGQKLQRRAA